MYPWLETSCSLITEKPWSWIHPVGRVGLLNLRVSQISPMGWKGHPSGAAAAAAKSLQSCLTLCDPIDGSPPGSPVLGILQARTLEWVAISFSNAWKWKVKVKSLSRVQLLATPWTAAYQASLSMGFSRQEYWSGVPLPSPPQGLRLLFSWRQCSKGQLGAFTPDILRRWEHWPGKRDPMPVTQVRVFKNAQT